MMCDIEVRSGEIRPRPIIKKGVQWGGMEVRNLVFGSVGVVKLGCL